MALVRQKIDPKDQWCQAEHSWLFLNLPKGAFGNLGGLTYSAYLEKKWCTALLF
jgi:hypothetical protein